MIFIDLAQIKHKKPVYSNANTGFQNAFKHKGLFRSYKLNERKRNHR